MLADVTFIHWVRVRKIRMSHDEKMCCRWIFFHFEEYFRSSLKIHSPFQNFENNTIYRATLIYLMYRSEPDVAHGMVDRGSEWLILTCHRTFGQRHLLLNRVLFKSFHIVPFAKQINVDFWLIRSSSMESASDGGQIFRLNRCRCLCSKICFQCWFHCNVPRALSCIWHFLRATSN